MAASEILHIHDKRRASRARAALQVRDSNNLGAGKKRPGLSGPVKQSRSGQARRRPAGRVFPNLQDLLTYYGRTAPRRKAIVAADHPPVTYGRLRVLVSEAVRELRSLGVSQTDRVAVVLPRGSEAAVAVLAVATAAVCVPLNPSFTADEWQRYFADLQITVLLVRADMDSPSRSVAQNLGIPVINLSPQVGKGSCTFNLLGSAIRQPVTSLSSPAADDDAFILMTSGTTSRPKTVPLTHASVCLSAHNAAATLELGGRDRLLNVLPLYHAHGLISGLLTALSAGSTVVCTREFNPDTFFGWLTKFQPTWYTAVPTIHRALLSVGDRHKHSLKRCSLRVIRSASATLPYRTLHELESLFGVPVIETYGMTEAASQIAANPLGHRKPGSVGLPAGAEIAIMDHEGRQLRAGERGEIVLRGPTIMRGYDNDVAATESGFRDGWFRTGDLGYLDQDGYLFIVGRAKEVIKRGGLQVAPAEVEEALLRHPHVTEAVAFSIPHERLGEDVAAAVVLRPGVKVTVQKLRSFASESLAQFKVPGLIRVVPEIPKRPGGKINRSELAAALSLTPDARAARLGDGLPRSKLEQQLAKLWADVLQIRRVNIDQDVFALGADSLSVTLMLSRLRKHFGVEFSFKDMFDSPTVAALASRIGSSQSDPVEASLGLDNARRHAHAVPLSFQQQRIHVLSRLDPTGRTYHVLEVARLSGPVDLAALEASIATICERHEVLRMNFLVREGEPVQRVRSSRFLLEHFDLRSCAKRERGAAIDRHARELLGQSLDISKELPLRAQLLQFDGRDHALVIKLHHLITDGWSQRLFWGELEALYRAKSVAGKAHLAKLPMQYRHFVEWQREWLETRAAKDQLAYWNEQLRGLTELPLRMDRPRPETWSGRGARHPLKFSRALSRAITSLSRAHGATLFMTLLAAFQCLLHRYTNHEDVAVGSVIANRNQLQFEHLMGMFANTIVLRADLSGDPRFSEFLRRVRQVTLEAYRNQDLPFEEVLRTCKMPRSADRNTLFQTMFILQNPPPKVPALPGTSVRFVDVDPGTARVDLTLEVVDADGLKGWFEYSTDLFDASTIARMAAHFQTLLEAIVADPEQQISRLSLLPAKERRQVLIDWNDNRISSPSGTFFNRFARQVEHAPDAVAVSSGQIRLGYRELADRSAAVAHRIAAKNVGPDTVVILLAERGVDLLAAMIAVQSVGAAFLSLDPATPLARLTQIIQHSGTPLVLVGQRSATALEEALAGMSVATPPEILPLADLTHVPPRYRVTPARPMPSSLAYVIYTSGSTGVPKGAMVEQRGLLNHLLFKISELKLSSSDVIAQTAPQSFDISIWQFLAALMVGGRVHIFSDDETRDPARLAEVTAREHVTVLQIVPSLLRGILDRMPNEFILSGLSRLRSLICIGEALPPELYHGWFRYFPGVPLINAYGPAECSDTVATHRLAVPSPALMASVPIGRAIANTRLYVVDPHMQPVPIGVAGELCVGGIGVGRGYLNDPEQTRRNFLCDPFFDRRGARLYRTGDLARWRADGTLEFLGRVDHQVKIRGHRIELEEIEHILMGHPHIQDAVVLARDDLDGEARLFGYVVTADSRAPDPSELRDFLKTRLPEYMIPAGFIFLKCLPLTAHGKVNRAALASVRQEVKVAGANFVPPRDSTEQMLADIWVDLLKVDTIGVFDNFFDLGGHSLLAGRVLAKVTDSFGVSLPLRALFEAPSVAALARQIDKAREAQSNEPTLEISPVPGDGPEPVSLVQEQMLRTERKLPGLPQFNLPFAYRLRGALNVDALERSVSEVVRRHDSLRARFVRVDGSPVARIKPSSKINFSLVVENLAGRRPLRSKRAKALLLKKAELEAQREAWIPINVTRAPLFRMRLLRLGADDHVLILVFHHIIVDGWSFGIFMEEVSALYSAISAGGQVRLPEPTLRFSDFARWERQWSTSAAAARQLAYWDCQLRDASSLFSAKDDLAALLPGLPVAHEPIRVSNELVARLDKFSRQRGATLFMTLLTGFKTLLFGLSGRNDICVATAMANRPQVTTQRLIGPLVNTTLIRTRIDAELSFEEALGRVRESVLEAHARQELPYEILAARLADKDGIDPASLVQVFFVLHNAFRQPLNLPGIEVRPFAYPGGQRVMPIDRTWLSVMLEETPSGIVGWCSYKSDLFKRNALRRCIADYKKILARAAANPDISLGLLADC